MIDRRRMFMGGVATLAAIVAGSPAATTQPAAARAPVEHWPIRLIEAASRQIGVTTVYDPAYVRLAYPGGDVPRDRGVCTDVIVRAYRDAFGLDLQSKRSPAPTFRPSP